MTPVTDDQTKLCTTILLEEYRNFAKSPSRPSFAVAHGSNSYHHQCRVGAKRVLNWRRHGTKKAFFFFFFFYFWRGSDEDTGAIADGSPSSIPHRYPFINERPLAFAKFANIME